VEQYASTLTALSGINGRISQLRLRLSFDNNWPRTNVSISADRESFQNRPLSALNSILETPYELSRDSFGIVVFFPF